MSQNESDTSSEQPFISHLVELRGRLLRVVAFILVVFFCAAPFANEIYTFLSGPLLQHMPENSTMIATDVASPFFTPFKLVLVASAFFSVPVILFHFWGFVAPGLYSHEKKLVFPLLVGSTLLFYMGIAFAYYVVFPLVFGFLTAAAPEGVTVMTDISKYLDFVLTLFFAFGLSFEVPIITIILVWTGLTSPQSLAEKRPYVIVGAFIIGMFLTPPDAISQTLLAVPIWLLFEIGLLLSRLFVREDLSQSQD